MKYKMDKIWVETHARITNLEKRVDDIEKPKPKPSPKSKPKASKKK